MDLLLEVQEMLKEDQHQMVLLQDLPLFITFVKAVQFQHGSQRYMEKKISLHGISMSQTERSVYNLTGLLPINNNLQEILRAQDQIRTNHKLQIDLSQPNKKNLHLIDQELKHHQIYANSPKRLFKDTRSVETRHQYQSLEEILHKINRVILQHILVRECSYINSILNWMDYSQIQKGIVLIQKKFLGSM